MLPVGAQNSLATCDGSAAISCVIGASYEAITFSIIVTSRVRYVCNLYPNENQLCHSGATRAKSCRMRGPFQRQVCDSTQRTILLLLRRLH